MNTKELYDELKDYYPDDLNRHALTEFVQSLIDQAVKEDRKRITRAINESKYNDDKFCFTMQTKELYDILNPQEE